MNPPKYLAGVAFIVEGQTEEEFYRQYLIWTAMRHPRTYFREGRDNGEVCYIVGSEQGEVLIKFVSMNSISQITNSATWFLRSCKARHAALPWDVFLAYDTDGHHVPVTQFMEGDWDELRSTIGTEARSLTDLAAEADIEDVMLLDETGVLSFLGLPLNTKIPQGGKGKSKMKALFRRVSVTNAYHEGAKARSLVRALDMSVIAARSPIPFRRIEEVIWTQDLGEERS